MWFSPQLLRARRPLMSPVSIASALLRAAELSGACVPGRGKGVAAAAASLGRGIGMRPVRVTELRAAALLIDIGLIGMPIAVAQRSRPLTADEESEYELHPMRGLELARDLGLLYESLNGIMHHHERYDGLGYPMGLTGHEIPEFARILAIADAYESMTGGQAGEAKLSAEEALSQLRALPGSRFDPELVTVFNRVLTQR